ncbi:leukotriene B4 receptor 2b [Esox lucius]|uniref:leukotriene B4 receptor 2b n=1 Tax=Esox lucius TaxID=8010 RepID=UPI001476FAB9|nr:leukotriene B4 receptor 2b [Esox lucius]
MANDSYILNSCNSSGSSYTDPKTVSNPITTAIGALIMSIVFLLGVPGNLFIIWSIMVRARRRSVTTILILNLACADGVLMCLSIFFIVYLARRNWDFGLIMCKVLFYLCNTNMYASIFLITLMSLHRLVAVVWPTRVTPHASKKIIVRAIAVLWVLVFLISIPALLYRTVEENEQGDPDQKRWVCNSHHNTTQEVVFQYTFETTVGFLVPYGLIVSSYICIVRRIRQTKFRRNVRSEKLILAIVVTFGIFWLPYHIINIIQVVATQLKEPSIKARLNDIWRPSRAVTSALAFISSCANPILYTFAGKSYIRGDGMAFMARLFEGISLDYGLRKGRQKRDIEGTGIKETLSLSSTAENVVKNGI